MISQKIENGLNSHVKEDYSSWYFYRSAAAHCEARKLKGFSKWFRHWSEKKSERASKLSHFIIERNGRVEFNPIEAPQTEWDSPLSVLRSALEHEYHLTGRAKELVALALSEGDYATNYLLEKVVSEQTEAETKLETIVKRMELAGEEPVGLLMIDRSLA